MIGLIASVPWRTWRPKLLDTLRRYDRRTLGADLVAGLTVGVVALPLAMAFGIASGVTPQAGIHTAIVGGFLTSLLGGSSIHVSGPTGAFVVTADVSSLAPVVILGLRHMSALDATGLHALESLSQRLHSAGRALILCGARRRDTRREPARVAEARAASLASTRLRRAGP